MVIGYDVWMGAADWTEVEGGVTSLFQVVAHLQAGREVVSTGQITNKREIPVTTVTVAAVCT